MKPTKEAVITKLRQLIAEEENKDSSGYLYRVTKEKVYAGLRSSDPAEKHSCYCVEGLLCEAAMQLGFPAHWEEREGFALNLLVVKNEAGERVLTDTFYLPVEIAAFLGVKRSLKTGSKAVKKFMSLKERSFGTIRGVKNLFKKASSEYLQESCGEIQLWSINDRTPASLKEIMECIIENLEDQTEPETNETNS